MPVQKELWGNTLGQHRGMVVEHPVPARIVVCESSNRWAVALRRQLPADTCCEICETRHEDDCWEQSRGGRATAVVWEVRVANLDVLVAALRRYQTHRPRVPVFIVGSRELSPAEWLLRAAGAVHTVFSRRELGPLVRMLQRHWRLAHPAATQTPAPWLRLPWGRRGDAVASGPGPDWLHDASASAAAGTPGADRGS